MPSFDVVSEVDMQEVRNAVDQASRELEKRFDFKGIDASFSLEEEAVVLAAPEEFQIGQMEDILREKLIKRSVDTQSLEPGDVEGAGKLKRRRYTLRQGIDRDNAKTITRIIKDSKIKVQVQINGEKLRVTGKKRDELQEVIALLRNSELEVPLQFDNFRD
jgi:cyclic-di-GMP-binding protein